MNKTCKNCKFFKKGKCVNPIQNSGYENVILNCPEKSCCYYWEVKYVNGHKLEWVIKKNAKRKEK